MAGKDCVAIASDKRLGVQYTTVAMDVNRVFKIHDKLMLGLSGLMTDIQTLNQLFRYKLNIYEMEESRQIQPSTFANLVSSSLYEKRFGSYFSEPIIAGLDKENKPYLCMMDSLGALATAEDFVVSGTCDSSLFGTCETFWKPDLGPDELFETVSQSLLAALDRDIFSGWGATVYILTKDGIQVKNLVARMDWAGLVMQRFLFPDGVGKE